MSDSNNIEDLIAGGILGATFGALLSKDEEGVLLGALLGAAIAATIKANEEALKTNIPVLIEENGKLFEVNALGGKRFIKELKKSKIKLPEQFKLT